MKNKKRIDKKIFYIFCITMAVCFITVFCFLFNFNFEKNQKEFLSYTNDWYDEEGNSVDLKRINKSVTISKKIGDIVKDSQILISVKDLNIEVLIDDNVVYSDQNNNKELYGKTPGVYFVHVDLLREYSNQYITLKLDFPYETGSGKITDIQVGNYGDMTISFLSLKYLNSCICFVIIILGIALTVSFLPLFKKKVVNADYLYLGIFSLNIGIFMFTDGKVLQYIFGNESFFHTIAQLWMLLILVPLVLFMDRMYNEKNKNTTYSICILSLLTFVCVYLLNLFGIKDLHELVIFTHINYILGALYLFYLTFKNLLYSNNKKIFHAIGVLCIGAGTIIDMVVLYFGAALETSLFTRFGVLAFLFFEIIGIINENLKNYKREVKNEMLSKLAYHDGLTGVFNNYSFMEDMEYLENEKSNIIVVMFDVNNLKKVNDKYGHTYGNDLIIEAANSIKDTFSDIGKIYRIGGDEFAVLIRGKNYENIVQENLKKIDKILASKDYIYPFPISVASGYALFDSNIHKTLKEVFELADSRMYERKKEMKCVRQD